MLRNFFGICFFLFATSVMGQPAFEAPYTTSVLDFGSPGGSQPTTAVKKVPDGFLVAPNTTLHDNDTHQQILVIKTDDEGEITWRYTWNPGEGGRFRTVKSLVPFDDGTCVIVGQETRAIEGAPFILRSFAFAQKIRPPNSPEQNAEVAWSITPNTNGVFYSALGDEQTVLVAGEILIDGQLPLSRPHVLRIDVELGEILWEQELEFDILLSRSTIIDLIDEGDAYSFVGFSIGQGFENVSFLGSIEKDGQNERLALSKRIEFSGELDSLAIEQWYGLRKLEDCYVITGTQTFVFVLTETGFFSTEKSFVRRVEQNNIRWEIVFPHIDDDMTFVGGSFAPSAGITTDNDGQLLVGGTESWNITEVPKTLTVEDRLNVAFATDDAVSGSFFAKISPDGDVVWKGRWARSKNLIGGPGIACVEPLNEGYVLGAELSQVWITSDQGRETTRFTRGNTVDDGEVNLTDMVQIASFLFLRESLSCHDAADTNDDGQLNITDVVYGLNFLFRGGPSIPEPFSGLEIDPTPDALLCEGTK